MTVDFGRRWVPGRVEIKRVLKGRDGLGDVTAQPLQPLLHGGGGVLGGRGRRGLRRASAFRSVLGPHQDLLHRVLVRARSARPALQRRRHFRSRQLVVVA